MANKKEAKSSRNKAKAQAKAAGEVVVSAPVKRNTPIQSCTCKHEYQDKQYGKGKRLHNKTSGGRNRTIGYRCTVCSSVKA